MVSIYEKEKFLEAYEKAKAYCSENPTIGILSEKIMHLTLKYYFSPFDSDHEVKLGGFYADAVNEDGIVEVQTRSFKNLKEKLMYFLAVTNVNVVHPIPFHKYITWVNPETGEISKPHRSPTIGRLTDIFGELYGIKEKLDNPRLTITLMLIDTDDYKNLDGWSKDKKKGSTRAERYPRELIDIFTINSKYDLLKLLPEDLPETFSASDLNKLMKGNSRNSYSAINTLCYLNLCECIGKEGRKNIFRIKKENLL